MGCLWPCGLLGEDLMFKILLDPVIKTSLSHVISDYKLPSKLEHF